MKNIGTNFNGKNATNLQTVSKNFKFLHLRLFFFIFPYFLLRFFIFYIFGNFFAYFFSIPKQIRNYTFEKKIDHEPSVQKISDLKPIGMTIAKKKKKKLSENSPQNLALESRRSYSQKG